MIEHFHFNNNFRATICYYCKLSGIWEKRNTHEGQILEDTLEPNRPLVNVHPRNIMNTVQRELASNGIAIIGISATHRIWYGQKDGTTEDHLEMYSYERNSGLKMLEQKYKERQQTEKNVGTL